MNPDVRAIVIVIAVGGLIAAIATLILVLAFRAFGETSKSKPVALIAALIAFVFACCAALLWLSR